MLQSMRRPIPHKRQQGAVAVIFAIVITAMIGMAGLALDLGQLYVAKTELQNAADACALSAAQSLSGSDGKQLQISQAAGLTTAQRHRVLFQSRTVATQSDGSIEFAATLGGPWYHSSDLAVSNATTLTMRYARCALVQNNIPTWLIQTLNVLPGVNIGMQSMSASAVARLQPSQTTCAMPVAICQSTLGTKGGWLEGAVNASGALTGSFMWADLSPPQGGAAELAANLTGTGHCQLPPAGSPVGQAGNVASLANEYNSRFGIYQGNVRSAEAQPDRTGFAYTDNSFGGNWNKSTGNAYVDFVSKRTSNTPYQGGNSDVRGSVLSASNLAAQGGDRRIMIAPVVDCAAFQSSQTAPVQQWACVLMLHPIVNNASGNSQLVAGGSSTTGGNGNGNGNGNGKSNGNGNGNSGGNTSVPRMYLEYLGNTSDAGSPCASVG
ncbi:MAG: pilus assembly protein TadG-related protein, partial [Burkholderiaceae bacterium]